MSLSIIRPALEVRLKDWADGLSIPVAFQNVGFTKPNGTSDIFVEAFLIPNSTIDRSLDGQRRRYIGLFQVNVWQKAGIGMGAAETMAQQIVNLYPLVPKFGTVSIESTPSVGRALLESGWVIVPVLMHYRYET